MISKTHQFGALTVLQYAVLDDNYNFLLHSEETGETALIDPSESVRALHYLQKNNWQLSHIFNTHHHWDHTDGNYALKQQTGCTIFGAEADAVRIPEVDKLLTQNESFEWGGVLVKTMFLPGHTTGHIAYYLPQHGIVFSGDVIFAMGCGRLFEGTPVQALESLRKIANLPEETMIFCAHEYTALNGRFASSVEPKNEALQLRIDEVCAMRKKGEFTVPTSVALEKATNPFLRCDEKAIAQTLELTDSASELDIFTLLRERRNSFT